jgi:formylmethanofuran dehydrogenase subunit E
MMRLILFLLILYALYRLSFRYLPNLIRFFLKKVEERSRKFPKADAHDMVPCSTCGTYVSESSALSKSGRYFCSEKCCLDIGMNYP